jgi:hypothetical protein
VRDHAARLRTLTRNDVWSSWSRRHWRAALRTTGRSLRVATRNAAVRAGIIDATRGAGGVLRNRRRVDPWLERRLELLD